MFLIYITYTCTIYKSKNNERNKKLIHKNLIFKNIIILYI